jgi:hypothetical protein
VRRRARPFCIRKLAAPLSLGLLLSTVAEPVEARDPAGPRGFPAVHRLDGRPGAIVVEPSIRLEEIRPDEILSRGIHQAVSLGSWKRGAPVPDMRTAGLQVVRTIRSIWRMQLTDEATLGEIDVRFAIVGLDGRADCLAPTDGSDSEIRAVLRSTPPVVVSRDTDGAIVEGGLVLRLDLESVRTAGTYAGTLTVIVDHF